MTARFEELPVESIIIDRENRQRRELSNIEELARSIVENGLINPIVVTRTEDGVKLIAGERRLTAHKHALLPTIPVQYFDDLDPIQRHMIELEENVQRVDLSWQDRVRAVAEYHALRKSTEPEWSVDSTADALNVSQSTVSRQLLVNRALSEGVEQVIEAPKFSTAYNFAQRREERRKASAKRDLISELSTSTAEDALYGNDEDSSEYPEPGARTADIICANFHEWSKTDPLQEPFNFLHVDFPYGVSAGDTKGQSASKSLGGYADTREIYDDLCASLVNNLDRFCGPSAHLLFWFSMDYYSETLSLLREAGWRVDPFPLVWFKSDNTGILPDANRGPRRVYETAFFGSRGDRKIVRATGNAVGAASPPKIDKIHMSQKARPMLEHFLRMVVDESTRMLDPTCGSGEAVAVAEALGAQKALGLELNPEYVSDARLKLGLD